jgi:hypothetical protein
MKYVLFILFIFFVVFNYRFLNIGYLSQYSIDEYVFHGSLLRMFDGLTAFDIRLFFSYGFYSYGTMYWLINFIAVLPFIYVDNVEMSIYIPRLISSLFALGSLWQLYRIIVLFVDSRLATLISLFVLLMPGFFRNALYFHPDWMMTFFVVLAIKYLVMDNFEYKTFFWKSVFALGVSIAVKVQAITFIPLILFYIFYNNIKYRNLIDFKSRSLKCITSMSLIAVIFAFLNPYVLHPTGLRVFLSSFNENMKSNATNHGKFDVVTLDQKMSNAVDLYYFDEFIFLVLIILAFLVFLGIFVKSSKRLISSVLALTILINLLYLLFFVNKDWFNYYLPIFVILPLVFVEVIHRLGQLKELVLVSLLCIHFFSHRHHYYYVYREGYNNSELRSHSEEDLNESLTKALRYLVNDSSNVLISPFQPFDFSSIGLDYRQVHLINGPISDYYIYKDSYLEESTVKDPSRFVDKDIIVLSKDDIYFREGVLDEGIDMTLYGESVELIRELLDSANPDYKLIEDNNYFYIWQKRI